jgi:hypothetical protein
MGGFGGLSKGPESEKNYKVLMASNLKSIQIIKIVFLTVLRVIIHLSFKCMYFH